MNFQTTSDDHAATNAGEGAASSGNGRAASSIRFVVPGAPQGKQRPKAVKIGGFTRLATPQKTVAYEGLVAHAAQLAMAGRAPLEGPVMAKILIRCAVPASWSAKKQRQALSGEILPTTKPDIDNVVKAIFDGCNGVTFRDDVQVARLIVAKGYHATPGVQVRFEPIVLGPAQDSLGDAP